MNTQERKKAYETDMIYGSTVRQLEPAPRRIEAVPNKKNANIHRKNRERARNMTVHYVLFLVGALFVSALTLYTYLGLQSDITRSIRSIARLERELNNVRLANEENLSRIINNVDLDYIRRVAITELGMVYAGEDQIIIFDSNRSDYVRQLNPISSP